MPLGLGTLSGGDIGGWYVDRGTSTTSTTYYISCTSSASTTGTSYYDYNGTYNSVWVQPRRGYGYYESHASFLARERAKQKRLLETQTEAARLRAMDVLLEHLTPEQRKTFEENKWFVVEGGKSKRKYRIENEGTVLANIAVLDGERVSHRLCGHCDVSNIPLGDHLLAQKLMLEAAEDAFLALANRHAA